MPFIHDYARSATDTSRGRDYYLLPSGNPYASIDAVTESDADEPIHARPWQGNPASIRPLQQAQLNFGGVPLKASVVLKPTPASSKKVGNQATESKRTLRDTIKKLGNPYAKLFFGSDEESAAEFKPKDYSQSPAVATTNEFTRGVSIKQFRSACREVFIKYEPLSSVSARLRPEFAAFVSLNERKPSSVRTNILKELVKYRICDHLQPHLNRERIDSVLQKLEAISKANPG